MSSVRQAGENVMNRLERNVVGKAVFLWASVPALLIQLSAAIGQETNKFVVPEGVVVEQVAGRLWYDTRCSVALTTRAACRSRKVQV